MKTAFRILAAVIAGLLVAFLLIVSIEFFSSVVHPVPEDFGGTQEEMCRHVEQIPPWFLAVVVPAWAAAAFIGTWIAQRIGNLYSAATVGLLLLAALIFNVSSLPYPMWFKIANLIVIPIASVAGSLMAMRPKTAGAGEAH